MRWCVLYVDPPFLPIIHRGRVMCRKSERYESPFLFFGGAGRLQEGPQTAGLQGPRNSWSMRRAVLVASSSHIAPRAVGERAAVNID